MQRLQIPSGIPSPIKSLTENCWAHEPHSRPTFEEVFVILEELFGKMTKGKIGTKLGKTTESV